MKNLFLAVSLMFLSLMSAQTEKGSFIISGQTNLNFTSNTAKYGETGGQLYSDVTTNTFNFSPNFGYFIIDNLAIGVLLDYKTVKRKRNNDMSSDPFINNQYPSKETVTTFSFIPNATYYFSEGKIRPYLNAGAGLSTIQYNNDANVTGFTWTANGGILVFIAKKVALDMGLGYANYTIKRNGLSTISNAFGANVGVSIFLK